MKFPALFLLLALTPTARADISDSGNLTLGGSAVIAGSATASSFWGDGSHLTGVAVGISTHTPTRQVLTYYTGKSTASVTSGSSVLSSIGTSTGIYAGIGIQGTDIAANAYITAVYVTSATMSANATGGSGTTITFTALSTGTYVLPFNGAYPRQIRVRMVGGGGGGAGAGNNQTAGSTTTFNSVNASGGGAGSWNNISVINGNGGTQGAGGSGGTGTASFRSRGEDGGPAYVGLYYQSDGNGVMTGGRGGGSVFGGGLAGPYTTAQSGTSAPAGSGVGGGGGGGAGGGGGGGEYAELIIDSPASAYGYTVGAGGSGGTGSPSGGSGGSGRIIIDEYY